MVLEDACSQSDWIYDDLLRLRDTCAKVLLNDETCGMVAKTSAHDPGIDEKSQLI